MLSKKIPTKGRRFQEKKLLQLWYSYCILIPVHMYPSIQTYGVSRHINICRNSFKLNLLVLGEPERLGGSPKWNAFNLDQESCDASVLASGFVSLRILLKELTWHFGGYRHGTFLIRELEDSTDHQICAYDAVCVHLLWVVLFCDFLWYYREMLSMSTLRCSAMESISMGLTFLILWKKS